MSHEANHIKDIAKHVLDAGLFPAGVISALQSLGIIIEGFINPALSMLVLIATLWWAVIRIKERNK